MKLLLDQNLSYKLVRTWATLFPRSTHVRLEGMMEAADRNVWEFARVNGYTIISKDTDFESGEAFPGPPPRVVSLTIGNAPSQEVDALVRANADVIKAFEHSAERALII